MSHYRSCFPCKKYNHVQLSPEQVRFYVQKFGSRCFSYCHLHNANYHFEVEGVGLLSYVWVSSCFRKVAIVLVDPLVETEADTRTLMQRFIQEVPGTKLFCVSNKCADVLRELGYNTTVLGKDYYADFGEWNLTRKSSLRRYLKQGANDGLVCKEQTFGEVDKQRVMEISKKWLKTKKWGGCELQAMTWPFYPHDEWNCRKFFAYNKEGNMLGYIFFIPCFKDFRIVGWCANILRRDPDTTPKYVLDYIIMTCAETFRREQCQFLSIAPAILHGCYSTPNESHVFRNVIRFTLACPSRLHFYPFTSLGEHKDHFKANRVEDIYACAKGFRNNVLLVWLSLTVTNIIPIAKWYGIHS